MLPQSEYFKLWRVRVIRYFCDICGLEKQALGPFTTGIDPLFNGHCEECYHKVNLFENAAKESVEIFKRELRAQAAVKNVSSGYIPAGYGAGSSENGRYGVFGGSKPLCPPTLSGMNVGLDSIGKHEYARSFDNLANPMPLANAVNTSPYASSSANSPDVDKNGFSIKHWQEKAAFEEGLKLSDDIARARVDGYKGGYEAGYANAKLDSAKANTPTDITSGIVGGALRDGWSNK